MKLECYMKEMEGQLSPSQKKICSFLLEHRGQAAMLTVQELANTCQVSIATASRFVKQLGFGSYGEFQNELQNEVLKKIGTAARLDMERFLGARVNLQCFVKVKEDWRNSDYLIRDLGLSQ